jgi:SAM-dependent methyltransferase
MSEPEGPTSSLRWVHRSWEAYGRQDPLWAVLADPAKRGGRWDVDEFLATGQETVDRLLARVAALGVEVPDGPALDFGCGVGRLTQALAHHFPDVHGVDISESMVAEARRINRFPDRVHYHVNARPDLGSFDDGQFAFALSCLVLQHIPVAAAKGYLRELGRVLAPGGALVVQIASGRGPGSARLTHEALPPPVRTILLRARSALTGRPGMEMHPIARPDVERVLEAAGLHLRGADEVAAGGWTSVTYIADRPSA